VGLLNFLTSPTVGLLLNYLTNITVGLLNYLTNTTVGLLLNYLTNITVGLLNYLTNHRGAAQLSDQYHRGAVAQLSDQSPWGCSTF
jgi:hypothetical protein